MKFLVTVLQTEPVEKLQSFAENNEQTQGKFTIGDEKASFRKELHNSDVQELIAIGIQRVHESRCGIPHDRNQSTQQC